MVKQSNCRLKYTSLCNKNVVFLSKKAHPRVGTQVIKKRLRLLSKLFVPVILAGSKFPPHTEKEIIQNCTKYKCKHSFHRAVNNELNIRVDGDILNELQISRRLFYFFREHFGVDELKSDGSENLYCVFETGRGVFYRTIDFISVDDSTSLTL